VVSLLRWVIGDRTGGVVFRRQLFDPAVRQLASATRDGLWAVPGGWLRLTTKASRRTHTP
jgi:hypothetical protein